jgi:hypothetical protein
MLSHIIALALSMEGGLADGQYMDVRQTDISGYEMAKGSVNYIDFEAKATVLGHVYFKGNTNTIGRFVRGGNAPALSEYGLGAGIKWGVAEFGVSHLCRHSMPVVIDGRVPIDEVVQSAGNKVFLKITLETK